MDALITWMGGKKQLREAISKHIPKDIGGYIEPFGGAGWVMLHSDRWARLEVWNDINNDLYNMFMQVKFHPEGLQKELELMPHSRKLFNEMRNHNGLTELQRAARFIYLVRHSFGALMDSFGTGKTQGGGGRMMLPIERISPLAKRLDSVTIESLDYGECIAKYDSKSNFFYCDPPYVKGATYDNSKGFDHKRLFEVLDSISGRFLLSYDDTEETRSLYCKYRVIPISRKKGIAGKHAADDYKELLIMNYDECGVRI